MQYLNPTMYEYQVIIVITQGQSGAEDKCYVNDNLKVQQDLSGFYPSVIDVCNFM